MASKGARDWEKFWDAIWYNLFHVLGVIALFGVIVGLGWGIFFAPSSYQSTVNSTASTDIIRKNVFESEARQIVTNTNLLNATAPCARKSKSGSDISNCSVFGLRLGMSYVEAKTSIDSSGYFSAETVLNEVGSKEPGVAKATLSHRKDGFYLAVEFLPTSPGDTTRLKASYITFEFGPGAFPYFEPISMRPVFRRMFGPPDMSDEHSDEWGNSEQRIRAYTYNESYWVVFSQTEVAVKNPEAATP